MPNILSLECWISEDVGIHCNYWSLFVGFLSTEDSTVVSGNMGLSDQVMALHWVQDNIDRFRGRPHEVTLVGHEAGAACVGILMLSPIAGKLSCF